MLILVDILTVFIQHTVIIMTSIFCILLFSHDFFCRIRQRCRAECVRSYCLSKSDFTKLYDNRFIPSPEGKGIQLVMFGLHLVTLCSLATMICFPFTYDFAKVYKLEQSTSASVHYTRSCVEIESSQNLMSEILFLWITKISNSDYD